MIKRRERAVAMQSSTGEHTGQNDTFDLIRLNKRESIVDI